MGVIGLVIVGIIVCKYSTPIYSVQYIQFITNKKFTSLPLKGNRILNNLIEFILKIPHYIISLEKNIKEIDCFFIHL